MSRRRLSPSLSTAARVALVSGLIGTLLAGGFAYWLRRDVYHSRYAVTEEAARADLLRIRLDVLRTHRYQGHDDAAAPVTYEIANSAGKIIEASDLLKGYQGSGPVAPTPRPGRLRLDDLRVTVRGYNPGLAGCVGRSPDDPRCHQMKRLNGRNVKVVRSVATDAMLLRGYFGTVRPDAQTTSIAVFVMPFAAEDAVAAVDRVLRPALPLAVLVIMLGVYVGTRAALRPVERIRAQAAAIGERNLHERVPVPPRRDVMSRLALTLNDTLGRLESAADRQHGFIADAAHELRSPIAGLRATLEVAAEHPDRADWKEVVRAAADETRRLQALSDDLLLVARLDADHTTPTTQVDLAELVRRHLARRIEEDGPALELDAVEEAPVLGNDKQLDRLVRNLVDNAVQHAAGRIVVRVERTPTEVVLRVDDDGPGIPVPARARVLERFTRLDESRSRDEGGAGLGLAIVQEISTRHGGALTIGDSPLGGARVSLVLPVSG
ncbi:HAMP domain-containing sensor histidine kinase [Kribbella sp.]|uniref:sensor histidine kinase n=1 Tax=Kribbella sp. TaxID=1871183 RepID=UPI002D54B982|nr:HAMP domain-containing sensor histidine kinase [Kribbella sp.]HZX05137.1 HAMP domain-containing sensor histidine kinase [Kribbella sp.]